MSHANIRKQRLRRKRRVRRSLVLPTGRRQMRPRLSVMRSLRHIYVQVIDDQKQQTLAMASSQDQALNLSKPGSVDAARQVGKVIAERARAAGVGKVVFDRGVCLYHGRIKALAEAARENGLEF